MKKITAIIAAALTAAVLPIRSFAQDPLEDAARYILSAAPEPQIGSVGGEWAVIGLARSGACINDSYFTDYYGRVEDYVRENNGIIDDRKNTEYSRVILALTAIGKNPENVCGFNLLTALDDYEKTISQGVNGSAFALIALDSADYSIRVNPKVSVHASREMYINDILSHQLECGAFENAYGAGADIDVTAMALTALSDYTDNADIKSAVDKALVYISSVQEEDGGFSSGGMKNSESASQVLTALSALGIDEIDERFVKNDISVNDNLLSFAVSGGGYSHEKGGSADLMASEQALYALAAAKRAALKQNPLFDMSDVSGSASHEEAGAAQGLPGKNPDVRKLSVINEGISFSDVSEGAKEIEALAARSVINGKSREIFAPEDSMTRAELAAIMVRGLGLPLSPESSFSDVNENDWFRAYVGAAARYGIVNGISPMEFNPYGTITCAHAELMCTRAAKLCGISADMKYDSIGTEPERAIKRREAAVMLYDTLYAASLIE